MTQTEKLIQSANAWIDAAYAALAAGQPDFRIREPQVGLSKDVARSFIDGQPLVAEAPTGTGKTLAYLLGGLAASVVNRLEKGGPIVVSTATKALQQQLVSKDLPMLATAGLVSLGEVAIAKGKGNYLCLQQAEEVAILLEQGENDPELFLDDSTGQLDSDQVGAMLQAFNENYWDGDFDNYTFALPKGARSVAVSSETCLGRKCPQFLQCPYYKARMNMSDARIVVVNHDLLLMDLLMASQEIEPTLPLSNYLVVFDEAHHLPEKAIRVGSTVAPLTALQRTLPKLSGIQKLLQSTPALLRLARSQGISGAEFDRVNLGNDLRALVDMLSEIEVDEDSGQKRFVKGDIPVKLLAAIAQVEVSLGAIVGPLTALCAAVREHSASLGSDVAERASELIRRSVDVKVQGDAVLKCFVALKSISRVAKWLFRKDGQVSLHTAPLEGADVLKTLLWTNKRTSGVAMVSATLRDVGGFTRFVARSGLPTPARFKVLPYTFPYKQSELVVAAMHATPKQAERRMFLSELSAKLPAAIDRTEATLILFPSWSLLREFAPQLKSHFGDEMVRVQGDHPIRMLVQEHCRAIEHGQGGILMGVASMAEGLDLPGRLCTHVIIISLPFAVPSEPVEQELADLLGPKYFSERSLPDAMVKLTQMVGRLLRRETDVGKVTVFDRRLASTNYGRQMLANLPPFKKVIQPVSL